MRFYNGQHRFYCGVDLHTKRMYLCILDHEGIKRLHRNVHAKPHDFLNAIQGFRDDLVVGVECMFTWYWLADFHLDKSIEFGLGPQCVVNRQLFTSGIRVISTPSSTNCIRWNS